RASDAVDSALRDGVVFETQHALRHANRLEDLWRATTLLGILLGASSLLLTALAAWLALRAIAREAHFEEGRRRELELFSSRVAHDLLSPLQAAALAVRQSGHHADEVGRQSAERCLAAIGRVQQIVEGLLAFARAGARVDRSASASVPELLERLVPGELLPQATAAGIELTVDRCAACEVACGPGILAVLLTNLVRNAIKFMDGAARREIQLRIAERGRVVRFEIHDSGPGMPDGFERYAFDPYTRGRNATQPGADPGLGLGLATVRRLVEAHGGAVGLGRSPLGGLLAWLELPRALPAKERAGQGVRAPVRA
ncbi:MAG: sensor histidine kinase, partial [Deltaproteobacteria bacterium]